MKRPHLLAAACLLLGLSFAIPASAQQHATFPMQPNAYRAVLQQRIDSVWGVIERKLAGHNVSVDRKKQIRAMLDDAAKDVWAAFNKAAADGTISRAEADHLREATRGLRAKVRSKMAAERRATHADKSKNKNDKPGAAARTHADRHDAAGNAAAAHGGAHKSPAPPSAKHAAPAPRPAGPHEAAPPASTPHAKKKNKHKTAETPAPHATVARPPGADESGE